MHGSSTSKFEEIRKVTEDLVKKIRELSRSQKDLWQRVPFLALQADGRTGYNDAFSRAYRQGYWAVEASLQRGYYAVYVDLETGELVDASDPRKPARGADLLPLTGNPCVVNAAGVIEMVGSWIMQATIKPYDKAQQANWRESLQRELGLKPDSYARKVSVGEIARSNAVAGFVD